MKTYHLFYRLFDYKMWFHDLIKALGIIPISIDLRVKRLYFGNKKHLFRGKYIISANHMSYIDPAIIISTFWKRRVGFVATEYLFNKKWFGAFLKGVGCIPVNKDNPSLKTFEKVKDMLNRGHLVCVFPEGKLNEGNLDTTYKPGIVLMAIMAEVDILPIYIVKRTNRLKRQIVVIGEKINYKDYIQSDFPTMAEIETITNVLIEKEKALKALHEMRRAI